jgi:hypothetical protein
MKRRGKARKYETPGKVPQLREIVVLKETSWSLGLLHLRISAAWQTSLGNQFAQSKKTGQHPTASGSLWLATPAGEGR